MSRSLCKKSEFASFSRHHCLLPTWLLPCMSMTQLISIPLCPIAMSSRSFVRYRTSVVGDRTIVEVQLQNLCSTPVVIRDVAFTPASGFALVPCSSAAASNTAKDEGSTSMPDKEEAKEDVPFGRGQQRSHGSQAGKRLADVVEHSLASLQAALLPPGAFKRKLFVLTSGTADKSEQPADDTSHDIPRLGHLHVDWSGPMGESSRLAFAPLKCHVKSALPVEVTTRLAEPSQRIVYGRPFTIILTIKNKSELPMHLSLRVPMRTFAPVAPLNMLQEQLGKLTSEHQAGRCLLQHGKWTDWPTEHASQPTIVDRLCFSVCLRQAHCLCGE